MTQLIAAANAATWLQHIIFAIFAWLTGMGMIVSTLVIIAFILLIVIGSSEQ